jgi:2-keto-4-pentenoate hydratase
MNSSMNLTNIAQASIVLRTAWRTGQVLEGLPSDCRPTSRIDGYKVQGVLEEHSDKPLFGWKIAATSIAGQQHIGVDGPMAGRLLGEQICQDGAQISLTNNRMRVAECEFAFSFGKTLAPRVTAYSIDEVMAAVASLHPAIEIPDSRYAQFESAGAPQLIADNACAHLFVLGAAATCNWRVLNLRSHAVTASVSGSSKTLKHHHGVGSNVLGDPRFALTWLVNELSSIGVPLQKGQVVTTGTCIVPIAVEAGDEVLVSFGPIGDVRASFIQ